MSGYQHHYIKISSSSQHSYKEKRDKFEHRSISHSDIEGALGRLVGHFNPVRVTNIFEVIIATVNDVDEADINSTS
jgi:hypothetical protein